jgi:hypothetical protein
MSIPVVTLTTLVGTVVSSLPTIKSLGGSLPRTRESYTHANRLHREGWGYSREGICRGLEGGRIGASRYVVGCTCVVARVAGNDQSSNDYSMCFLPNSLASTDHAPGPIMANAAPSTATTIEARSPALDQAIQAFRMATAAPATGVHRPSMRNAPAAAPTACGTINADAGVPHRPVIPWRSDTPPITTRWSRSPAPGHPSANVENRRCRPASRQDTAFAGAPNPTRVVSDHPPKVVLNNPPFSGVATR